MSIRRIQRKTGIAYQVRILNQTGTGKYQTFRTLKEASEFELRLKTQKSFDQGRSISLGRMTVNEFYEKVWFPNQVKLLGKSTQDSYKTHYELHIKPDLGNTRLSDLKASDGDKLITKLKSQDKKPKGINLIVRTFKTMLNHAVERDYLTKNPLNTVKSLKEPKKLDSYWETEEAKQFLESTQGHYSHPLFVTALNTGMRRGELAALRWRHIDLKRKQISVTGTKGRYGDTGLTKGRVDRVIPLNSRLVTLFTELSKGKSPLDYVFVRDDGQPINPHHLYRLMNLLRVRAGVNKKIRFHDLRHTFASHFMMNGGSITQLGLILGHTEFKTTQRYIHFAPNYLDGASDIVTF